MVILNRKGKLKCERFGGSEIEMVDPKWRRVGSGEICDLLGEDEISTTIQKMTVLCTDELCVGIK